MTLKKNKYVKAFILCVFISAVIYTAYISYSHYIVNEVFPDSIIGFFFLVLAFSFIFALVLGAPMAYLFWRFKVKNIFPYLISGSCSVGFAVTVSNNFIFQQHPEGFIIGGIAGLMYWFLTVNKRDRSI